MVSWDRALAKCVLFFAISPFRDGMLSGLLLGGEFAARRQVEEYQMTLLNPWNLEVPGFFSKVKESVVRSEYRHVWRSFVGFHERGRFPTETEGIP